MCEACFFKFNKIKPFLLVKRNLFQSKLNPHTRFVTQNHTQNGEHYCNLPWLYILDTSWDLIVQGCIRFGKSLVGLDWFTCAVMHLRADSSSVRRRYCGQSSDWSRHWRTPPPRLSSCWSPVPLGPALPSQKSLARCPGDIATVVHSPAWFRPWVSDSGNPQMCSNWYRILRHLGE